MGRGTRCWSSLGKGRVTRQCVKLCDGRAHIMIETLSIRIDSETKKGLDALAKRSKRSKSFVAAEAITAFVESEE